MSANHLFFSDATVELLMLALTDQGERKSIVVRRCELLTFKAGWAFLVKGAYPLSVVVAVVDAATDGLDLLSGLSVDGVAF